MIFTRTKLLVVDGHCHCLYHCHFQRHHLIHKVFIIIIIITNRVFLSLSLFSFKITVKERNKLLNKNIPFQMYLSCECVCMCVQVCVCVWNSWLKIETKWKKRCINKEKKSERKLHFCANKQTKKTPITPEEDEKKIHLKKNSTHKY